MAFVASVHVAFLVSNYW